MDCACPLHDQEREAYLGCSACYLLPLCALCLVANHLERNHQASAGPILGQNPEYWDEHVNGARTILRRQHAAQFGDCPEGLRAHVAWRELRGLPRCCGHTPSVPQGCRLAPTLAPSFSHGCGIADFCLSVS